MRKVMPDNSKENGHMNSAWFSYLRILILTGENIRNRNENKTQPEKGIV